LSWEFPKKIDMSQYIVQSPISNREEAMYTHFETILQDCEKIMEESTSAYTFLHQLVSSRKARTRHRINLANLLHFLPFYGNIVGLFMTIMEGGLFGTGYFRAFVTKDTETDFSGKCASVTAHLSSVIKNNEWRRVILIMDAFLSETPKTDGLNSISMAEARGVWGDVSGFITRLQGMHEKKK